MSGNNAVPSSTPLGGYGITGHIGTLVALAWCIFFVALLPIELKLPFLIFLLAAIALGTVIRLRGGAANLALAIGLTLTLIFAEPLAFFGGPIFFASLVLYPVGTILVGLVAGARLRWLLAHIADTTAR